MGTSISTALSGCLSKFSQLFSPSGHPRSVDIKGARYSIQRLLGEGGYGYVYLAFDSTGSPLALKRFVVHEPEHQDRFLEEVRIHRSLCPHATIVGFVEHAIKQESRGPLPEVWMSMEYCQGPSLQALVNQAMMERKDSLGRDLILSIASDVVDAIAHMHSQSPPISHWDLKLDNVLKHTALDGTVTWKLCDFGSASSLFYVCRTPQEIQIAETELSLRMTTLYRAPETLDLWNKKRVDTKADVWSLGVLLYTLIMMEMPFEENPLEIIAGIPRVYQGANSTARLGGPPQVQSATTTVVRKQPSAELQDIFKLVMDHMLVVLPESRSDIFTIGQQISLITGKAAPAKPKPGMTSAQKARFA